MAATLTTIVKPNNIAPKLKVAVYQIALDSSYPAGGEAIDLSGDFDYIYAATVGGNDTAADNNYLYQALLPAPATAVTSSNVLIQAIWDPADAGAAEDFVEVTATTDLSAVGQLSLVVFGS
jgi:hypothetical protein